MDMILVLIESTVINRNNKAIEAVEKFYSQNINAVSILKDM